MDSNIILCSNFQPHLRCAACLSCENKI